jgi:hypothetical protein
MNAKNKKIRAVSIFLLILIIVPSVLLSKPKQAKAVFPVMDVVTEANTDLVQGDTDWIGEMTQTEVIPGIVTIEENTGAHLALATSQAALKKSHSVIVQILIAMGHMVLQKLTQSTVNWINSGFHGSPLFVQNPTAFFADIGKTEIIQLVNMTGYNTNNYPFGKNWDMNIINRYKNASQNDMVYSLNQVMNDHPNYLNNFNSGGWSAFFVNTQYPQNNTVGYDILATQELAQKLGGTVQNTAQKAQTILAQGAGFLSPTMCPSNIPNAKAYNSSMSNEFQPKSFDSASYIANHPQPVTPCEAQGTCTASEDAADTAAQADWTAKYAAAQNDYNATSSCRNPDGSSALVATTPGAVVANQIMTKLDSGGRLGEFDAALGNSISAILNALMNHFMQSGLSSLSGAVSSMPDLNSWSYGGQTLGTSTTTASTTSTLIVPQSVTVQGGTTTSGVTISGGTAPYSLQTQPAATIATAQIGAENGILTVTGVGSGQTSFVIQDSSSPAQTATVQVTTSLIIDFSQQSLLPTCTTNGPPCVYANIPSDSTSTSGTSITIQGGTDPYTIVTDPDPSIAIALISPDDDSILNIVGVMPGTTSITIQDSSTPAKTVTMQIIVGNESALYINPEVISVAPKGTATATISGGTTPYLITTPPNSSVAAAVVSGNTLNIFGTAAGTTSVTLKDSFSPKETISIPITVTTATTQGTCLVNTTLIPNVSESTCTTDGGVWTANN